MSDIIKHLSRKNTNLKNRFSSENLKKKKWKSKWLRKWECFIVWWLAVCQGMDNIAPSYDVFSNREPFSLNNLKLFLGALLKGTLTFSCSESVLQSLVSLREGEDVCKSNGVCCAMDFLCFLGWTTAVATRPEVLNFWVLVVASMVLMLDWLIGFLILALELFVCFANCEIMSAVSTSLWNEGL